MEDFELEDDELYEDDDYLSEQLEVLKQIVAPEDIQKELDEDLILDDEDVAEWFPKNFKNIVEETRFKNFKEKYEPLINEKLKINKSSYERVNSYRPIAEQASKETGVPTNLILGQIYQESRGRNAVSSAGARGISQFMPATAKQYGVDVNDPVSSIYGQAKYMKDLYKHYGDWDKAIMAYNAGQGNIDKGRIPTETRNYLPLVKGAASKFQTGGYAQQGVKYNNLGQPYLEQELFKVDNSKGYIPTNPQYQNIQNLDMSGYGNTIEGQKNKLNDNGIALNLVPQAKVAKQVLDITDDKVSSMLNTFSDLNKIGRDVKDFKARTISQGTTLANLALNTQESKRKRLREMENNNMEFDIYNPNSNNQIKSKSVLS